jgi:hypothetical protein
LSWDRVADQYVQLYERLLNGRLAHSSA